MSAVTTPAEKQGESAESAPLMMRIAQFMARMHVAPLPRNYDLFYQVLSGKNPENGPKIGKAILALGNAPSQADLDEIGRQYELAGHIGADAVGALATTVAAIGQISTRISASSARMSTIAEAADIASASRDDMQRLITEMVTEQKSLDRFVAKRLETVQSCQKGMEQLRATSLRDALTTLPNRLALTEKLAELYEDGSEITSAALILVNIDRFRDINADYGVEGGNRALRRLAALFRKTIKKSDFVARTGGNEFAFLFADASTKAAESIAERLRRSVGDLHFASSRKDDDRLTVSIGFADFAGTVSAAEFHAQAELALLAARCNGRNRAVGYSRDVAKRSRQSYLSQLGG